jgi:hypothetical protein
MPFKIHPRVAWQVVADEAVLVDVDRGRALGLNATGSFLWPCLPEKSAEELVRDLRQHFAVDEERARADVASFLAMLRERGLLLE